MRKRSNINNFGELNFAFLLGKCWWYRRMGSSWCRGLHEYSFYMIFPTETHIPNTFGGGGGVPIVQGPTFDICSASFPTLATNLWISVRTFVRNSELWVDFRIMWILKFNSGLNFDESHLLFSVILLHSNLH